MKCLEQEVGDREARLQDKVVVVVVVAVVVVVVVLVVVVVVVLGSSLGRNEKPACVAQD